MNEGLVKEYTDEKYFIYLLSSVILKAADEMQAPVLEKMQADQAFAEKLKAQLAHEGIFEPATDFGSAYTGKVCRLAAYMFFLQLFIKARFPEEHASMFNFLSGTALNELKFPDDRQKELQKIIKKIDSSTLRREIPGSVYNVVLDNDEQQRHGQHFTGTAEIDIINAFCIREDTRAVLDSGCGAGAFLLRAYSFIRYLQPELSEEEILKGLYGIEVGKFASSLARLNLSLSLPAVSKAKPHVLHTDFSKVKKKDTAHDDESALPLFDACIGNPPYIRQEMIPEKAAWQQLAEEEWGITKINRQSDLYLYYLMHTAAFLREGGRLGYVIASSWLDVAFGAGLQKFLLDHFKIIAIIDNQDERSFATASVNTVILIIEKCSSKAQREKNLVRFVRMHQGFEKWNTEAPEAERIAKAIEFVSSIENAKHSQKHGDYSATVISQAKLENESTHKGRYENGNWGARYLRSPDIFTKIIEKGAGKLLRLSDIADIKYGIKTGANDFFYLRDETEKALKLKEEEYKITFNSGKDADMQSDFWGKHGWYFSRLGNRHYVIEREYFQPIFKTQREAQGLETGRQKYLMLICNESKETLKAKGKRLLEYIHDAEKQGLHQRPSVKGRSSWYDLSASAYTADFIFPSKIGEKYRLIDNRKSRICCDKVNYVIQLKPHYREYGDAMFLILNSIVFRYFTDLFSRQLTGSQTLSDVDVNVLEKTLIIHPKLLQNERDEIENLIASIKSREQRPLQEEILFQDKKKIDTLIFSKLGLGSADVEDLYREAARYISDRAKKSASVKKIQRRQKRKQTSAPPLA